MELNSYEKSYVPMVVRKYIFDHKMVKPPNKRIRNDEFAFKSYSRWAAFEALEITEKSDHPVKDLMKFADKMERYALRAKGEASYIFSIAYDIVTDIICCLV